MRWKLVSERSMTITSEAYALGTTVNFPLMLSFLETHKQAFGKEEREYDSPEV